MQFVVPAAALKEVEKILGEDEMVTFILGPKHILFEVGNATLICRLLEGDFLDWRRGGSHRLPRKTHSPCG